MDWLDYRERLGLGFSDEAKTRLFLTKMFNILHEVYNAASVQFRRTEYFLFCNKTGVDMRKSGKPYDDVLAVLHDHSKRLEDFISYYMVFANCYSDNEQLMYNRRWFQSVAKTMLDEARIPYDIIEDEDGHFIFPKGAKELDLALVSQPLEWLSAYPQAHKTFVIALKQYSEGIYIRDVADNLRKALEAFLQEFLGNTKNLETNKNEVCRYLGEQGVDTGISGLFQPLINAYKNINDRIAKHNDAVDKKLLEFLLYQTGLLIRMVIVVKSEEGFNEA